MSATTSTNDPQQSTEGAPSSSTTVVVAAAAPPTTPVVKVPRGLVNLAAKGKQVRLTVTNSTQVKKVFGGELKCWGFALGAMNINIKSTGYAREGTMVVYISSAKNESSIGGVGVRR